VVMLLNQTVNQDQLSILKNNLKKFIMQLKTIEEYQNLIENIIELHLKFDEKSDLVRNIHGNLSNTMQTDAFILFDYFMYPTYLDIEELELDKPRYKSCLDCINRLKRKYGGFFSQLITVNRNPFFINSVETSVSNSDSMHSIRISRADGKTLDGVFKSDTMMLIVSNLISALQMSMEKGIFNINEQIVNNYIEQSKNLENYLNGLMNIRDANKEEM